MATAFTVCEIQSAWDALCLRYKYLAVSDDRPCGTSGVYHECVSVPERIVSECYHNAGEGHVLLPAVTDGNDALAFAIPFQILAEPSLVAMTSSLMANLHASCNDLVLAF